MSVISTTSAVLSDSGALLHGSTIHVRPPAPNASVAWYSGCIVRFSRASEGIGGSSGGVAAGGGAGGLPQAARIISTTKDTGPPLAAPYDDGRGPTGHA